MKTTTKFRCPHQSLEAMRWLIIQLPGMFCFYLRTRRLVRFFFLVICLLMYCEFFHYYVVLLFCKWPVLKMDTAQLPIKSKPLKVMILADTHILGWKEGHWFDKLRREWQMERSFQSSMTIHNPDVVFILGDLLDEGKWCTKAEFNYHVKRFKKMFSTPPGVETYVVTGNHDIGFHYMMTEQKHRRFEEAFSAPSVQMVEIHGKIFVLMNSMAMEGDGCSLCSEAVEKMEKISFQLKCSQESLSKKKIPSACKKMKKLSYTQPILMQHFPMFRPSDHNCSTPDAAPSAEKDIPFRPKYDCLSQEASKQVFKWVNPRLIVSAHTHHGCHRVHDNGVPEWTVASFSWRNKKGPSFLLAVISDTDFNINQCFLPNENTVFSIYVTGMILILLSMLLPRKHHHVTNCVDLSDKSS
ncbi:metallophosphoesterase 1-like [Saccostrea echinata]|uniref:metallophosphoesterase 1-like n=1 Tax=Saccostrea echinata TaxID=191078 RepID=UPI002A81FD28|nr:metallophosphoesterase 1-like [Saccostrea echinata]